MLTKNPVDDAPVNIRNFFSFVFPFDLIAKIKSINPSKEKIIIGSKNIGPLRNSFIGEIKNCNIKKMLVIINA